MLRLNTIRHVGPTRPERVAGMRDRKLGRTAVAAPTSSASRTVVPFPRCFVAPVALGLLLAACGQNDGRSATPGSEEGSSRGRGDAVPTAEDAIQRAQTYVVSRGKRITIQAPYTETRRTRIRCTAHDVDMDPNRNDSFLRRCQRPNLYPPYGRRWKTEHVRVCCRDRTIAMPSTGRWTARRSRSPQDWSVKLEIDIDSQKQFVEWTVDSHNGSVTERSDRG